MPRSKTGGAPKGSSFTNRAKIANKSLDVGPRLESLPILQYRYLVTVRQREFGLEYIDRAADLTEYEIVRSGHERTGDGKEKERDLPLVRQGRRGRCPLLRRDLPRQRSRCRPPRAGRLSVRQGGPCADGRIHRRWHSLPWSQRRSGVQT